MSIPLSLPEIPIAPPVVATMVDPDLRNARFVSHMPAIFTEQWQRELHCPGAGPRPSGPGADPDPALKGQGRARLLTHWPGPTWGQGQPI
jgi:hypothetical protein